MAVSKLNPAAAGIPYGDNAGRPANAETGQPYFNGEAGRLELYTTNGWNNIVQETPGVAGVSGHYYKSDGYGIFAISGTNFVDGAVVYAVGTNSVDYQATTTTYNSLVQLTARFDNLSEIHEPYDIKVVNPSNLFGLLPDAFSIDEPPVWSTSAGSLGSYALGSVNIQLLATDDESDTLTYSVISGSLPTGLSLSSSGLISGTMTAAADTYSFTVSVTDSKNTAVTRSFSIVSTGPSVTGGTLTSDSTYYYRTFTSNGDFATSGPLSTSLFIVAGGGPGGGAGGGGAGGVRAISSVSLTSGTYPVVIGSGGAGKFSEGGPTTYTSLGTNSTFNNISATRGGGGGGYVTDPNGTSGGSGGGGGNQGGGVLNGSSGNAGGYSPVEGYAGGSGGAMNFTNGGGGGAGGVGGNSTTSRSGDGGIGIQSSISGTSYYFGGGGGGGAQGNFTAGNGGNGGGGAGQASAGNTSGTPGAGLNSGGTASSGGSTGYAGSGGANTGGGGGGMGTSVGTSGNGGSGIVVIRYTKSQVGG